LSVVLTCVRGFTSRGVVVMVLSFNGSFGGKQ
jgi:hypothetical protein